MIVSDAAQSRREARYRRRFWICLGVSGFIHGGLLLGVPAPKRWSQPWSVPRIGFAGPELHIGELNPQDFPVEQQEQLASARLRAGALIDERVEIESESQVKERILERIGSGEGGEDRITNPVLELTEDWALRSTSAPTSRRNDFVILDMVRPTYPHIAIVAGIEGLVRVQATVDVNGYVTEVEILDSEVDGTCEEATKSAMRQWRFRPYEINGRRVEFRVIVPFRFRLE
jgi:TonB family protein